MQEMCCRNAQPGPFLSLISRQESLKLKKSLKRLQYNSSNTNLKKNKVLKTFPKGGVHPPENKITADSAIVTLSVPEQVTIPITQHIGAPARTVVEKGEVLRQGR